MNFLSLAISTVFGILEVFGQLLLSITFFRIPYRSYLFQLFLTSILISIVATLAYDVWKLPFITSEIILSVIAFLVIKMIFKTSIWNSFLIYFTGYLAGNLFYLFLSLIGVAQADDMAYEVVSTITVQFYLFVVFTLTSLFIYKKGWGFVFISEKMDIRPEYRALNMVIVSAGFLALITCLVGFYLYVYHYSLSDYAIVIYLALFILFICSIYVLSKRNMEERFDKMKIYKWLNK